MGRKKEENTIRAGTKAQADEILEEQENLISKVCGEVAESEDVINNSARNNTVAGVIKAYSRSKLDKLKAAVMTLMSMTEDSIIGGNISKLQQIAADYDLDSSYNNRDKLLEYMKQLEENLNLMRANAVVMVMYAPKTR